MPLCPFPTQDHLVPVPGHPPAFRQCPHWHRCTPPQSHPSQGTPILVYTTKKTTTPLPAYRSHSRSQPLCRAVMAGAEPTSPGHLSLSLWLLRNRRQKPPPAALSWCQFTSITTHSSGSTLKTPPLLPLLQQLGVGGGGGSDDPLGNLTLTGGFGMPTTETLIPFMTALVHPRALCHPLIPVPSVLPFGSQNASFSLPPGIPHGCTFCCFGHSGFAAPTSDPVQATAPSTGSAGTA